ncbi:MAG: hypothetical protein COT59_00480 [Candidatus Nealsonbacteria bacterium CG09_land_8_20_14_0_10_42_14]|uniref:Uncharacterized protein n=1 Tax=Candidatus Nealsonbacteria bacterium CG09_land_8_20_14_0_10_42_14 TaxID=1974707 RepID=A0A2H0WY15_9BACT|nr:MAG: hypothetical protein COT59_00480 [Candidatus Nealsonbacteria bacterium CG09_land_8_20_14_0_10_42_14]
MAQKNDKSGIDLSKKLEESAPKSQSGQWSPGPYVSSTTPKIIRWLIKYSGGLIKNERQAFYVILGFIVLAIIVSIFLFSGRGGEQEIFTPPPATGGP